MKSNLEPIEESDLDLEGKIRRGFAGADNKQERPLQSAEKETATEISSAEKDSAYGKILSKVQAQGDDDIDHGEVSRDAQAGFEKNDAEGQVSHLLDLAQQKGVVHAVKVARHMEDNYILDAFHDKLLAEEFHDALVKKGMIKEF